MNAVRTCANDGSRRALLLATLVGVVCLVACSSTSAPPPPARTRLRFASGMGGAAFYPLGEELARQYERVLPGLEFEIEESEGGVANVEALERGVADVALTHADVAYLASVGRLEGGRPPMTRLRGIAMLDLTRIHLVVRSGSGIDRVDHLRGRRIGLGRSSPGLTPASRMILGGFGLDANNLVVVPAKLDDAVRQLKEGALDAIFVAGSDPLEGVTRATEAGARLLPLDGPVIDRLRQVYPFFSRAVIPAGTYPHQASGIRTIGVDSVLLCRAGLSEPLVHDLTQRLFQVLPLLALSDTFTARLDLEQAPATPIPLHEGAARYYRERELLR